MTYSLTETEARQRIEELADDDQTVRAITHTGETDARAFFAVVRTWPHPEEPDLSIICLQNVQLTAEWADLTDTWLSGSWRQRVPNGDGDTARAIARSLAATGARLDADADDRPAEFIEVDR